MLKRYLCAPGPTAVPQEVLNEMAKPLIHHRTPQFSEILKENSEMLQKVFKTKRPVLTLSSSGTGGMEASVSNFLSRGDKAIVLSCGKFGERFAELCNAYGVTPIELKNDWGKDIKPAEVEKALKENPDAKAVYTEYSETSTAVAFDIKGIAEVVKKTDAILVVDGITAIGAMEFEMDDWGVDVAIAGAQKSFMIPPGAAFVSYSEKAEKLMADSDLPKYYLDLAKQAKSEAKNSTAFTPAVTVYIGLNYALKMMVEEGMDHVVKRHSILASIYRDTVTQAGLELFADLPNVTPSDATTAVKVPEGVDGGKIPKLMRDKYGVTIAGGQAHVKGKIFRLGHLGYTDKSDVVIQFQSLEYVLRELGMDLEPGKLVGTAQKLLLERFEV